MSSPNGYVCSCGGVLVGSSAWQLHFECNKCHRIENVVYCNANFKPITAAQTQAPVTQTPPTAPFVQQLLGKCIRAVQGCSSAGNVYSQHDGSAACDTCFAEWPSVSTYKAYANAKAAQLAKKPPPSTAAQAAQAAFTRARAMTYGWDHQLNPAPKAPQRKCSRCAGDWCDELDAWYGARDDERATRCSRCRR